MRQILIDRVRTRKSSKRGAELTRMPLDEITVLSTALPDDRLLALDEALERLAGFDQQQSRIVELRFFAGLTIDETAEALGISAATVSRDWRWPGRGCPERSKRRSRRSPGPHVNRVREISPGFRIYQ
jgi:RNA polymerase sigma factor (TIGR02999 family)